MENASKALLIAGSILIVILLIAMGVRIFSSTSGTTEQVQGTMQAAEVSMFNNKFMPYMGKNKSKAQVQSFLNLIIANNATNQYKITVYYPTASASGTNYVTLESGILQMVSNSTVNNYEIVINDRDNDGRITEIYIDPK